MGLDLYGIRQETTLDPDTIVVMVSLVPSGFGFKSESEAAIKSLGRPGDEASYGLVGVHV